MKKILKIAAFAVVLSTGSSFVLTAQESGQDFSATTEAVAAAAREAEPPADSPSPDFSSTFLINCIIPGYAQFATGRNEEGWLCVFGLPLLVAGQSLVFGYDYMTTGGIDLFGILGDPSTSPYGSSGMADPRRAAVLYGGRALTAAGLSLYAYSAYSYYRDTFVGGEDRSDFLSLLSAPFDPEIMLRLDTGGALFLLAAVQLFNNSLYEVEFQEYFESVTVPFLGVEMPPAEALTARIATQAVLGLLVAVGEETLYRGLLLPMEGDVVEATLDAVRPMYRLIVTPSDSEGVWLDLLVGSGWALYSTALTRATGNPRASVALRFWYGLFFSTVDYIVDPRDADDIGVSLRIVY